VKQFELVGTPKTVFSSTMLDAVKGNIKDSKSIIMVTGFLTEDGWNLIHDDIAAAIKRKCKVKLFSDSKPLNTDYSLLQRLNKELNKKGKRFYGMVFESEKIKKLHAKFFVFEKEDGIVVIITSSNITYPAFSSNLELGIKLTVDKEDKFYRNITRVIEDIEDNSREPAKEEYSSYLASKEEIEKARAEMLL